MPGLPVSFQSSKPSVPQSPPMQNKEVRDRLFPELLTTGFQQWAGTGLAQKPFPRPGEGGQCPLLRFLTAWRGGYQRRQFAVAISLMGR